MCYSILLFTPSTEKTTFQSLYLIQKVPLNSYMYLYDVVPPAQMITCQFLLCVKQYTIRRKERGKGGGMINTYLQVKYYSLKYVLLLKNFILTS